MKIDISFCIATDFSNVDRLKEIIYSIENQNISNYEILFCGEYNESIVEKFVDFKNIRLINFDESARNRWITKKKNIMSDHALNEILVFIHDYFAFNEGWYEGLCKYIEEDNEWSVLCNQIYSIHGGRFRLDWVTLNSSLLDYDKTDEKLYSSGGYFITKKDLFAVCKQNEDLLWGQQEDLDWTWRIKEYGPIKFNPYSTARLLKEHADGFRP